MTIFRWLFLAPICFGLVTNSLAAIAQARNDATAAATPSIRRFTGPKKIIKVEHQITDVAQARGGRVLILSIADAKKVAIFDCASQSIVRELTFSTNDFKVAGCLDHFVVVDNERSTIERYSLDTFEMEKAVKSPFGGKALALSCGASAAGPVLLRYSIRLPDIEIAEYVFLDLFKLESLGLILQESGPPVGSYFSDVSPTYVRPSAEGAFFSMWRATGSPLSCFTLSINGRKYTKAYHHGLETNSVPSADGRFLYTQNKGVLKSDFSPAFGERNSYRPCIPTSHPQFYLTLPQIGGAATELPTIHQTGDEEPLLPLPQIDFERAAYDAAPRGKYHWLDRRVYYYLPANLLITIPYSDASLVLQTFDLRAELDKARKAYLYVSSEPNRHFAFKLEADDRRSYHDELYKYQLEVASNLPLPTFKLLSGPMDMGISSTGLVTWKQRSGDKWNGQPVSIEVSNVTGRKLIHSFSIYRQYEENYQ